MKRIILSLVLLTMLQLSGLAQSFPGYSSENYSGVNGVFLNPASVVDSRYRWDFNLFSFNNTTVNNYATVNIAHLDSVKYKNSGVGSTSVSNFLENIDVHGPSIMFKLNSKSSLALTTRIRGMANLDNLPTGFVSSFIKNDSSGITFPLNINAGSFNVAYHLWAEAGITYGRVLALTYKHTLTGGITLKYLGGLMSGYASMKNFNATVTDSSGNYRLQPGAGQLAYATGGVDLANFQLSQLTQINGSGLGGDIGFSYEYRPNGNTDIKGSSHYKIKASIALLDVGAIQYNAVKNQGAGSYTLNTALNPKGDSLHLDRFSKVSSASDFNAAVKAANPMLKQNDSVSSYSMSLPTSLVAAIDYNVTGKLYLNLGGSLSLNKGSAKIEKTHTIDYLTFSPRYEIKSFAVAVPLTINEYSGFNAGVSLRLGPVFFGSGGILSTLISGKTEQADFHFGIELGSLEKNKKIKKKETPSVSTTPQEVPVVKATTAAPVDPRTVDTDGDGVPDIEDKCPTVPGLAKYNGCPFTDSDSDGVEDLEDKCPTVHGVAKYYGCPIPDTDGDGVNDEWDKCPTVYGSKFYGGCPVPDSDSDGVKDDSDKCPYVKGLASNFGCPVIKKEIIQKVNVAAKGLFFRTGKAIILKVSYAQLDKVVAILKADTSLNLTISGYTDNVGTAAKNLQLSADRANAAKTYFVAHGISADRIIAQGFGPANPIAPNTTAKGKAKNRRVEFAIKNY
jgi:outer membrane protein OmpA-like peptidoglycan-associated protein